MAPQPEDEMAGLMAGVAKWGILPGIALFLIWQMSTTFSADLHQLSTDQRLSTTLLQQHMTATTRMEDRQEIMISLLRQQCVNQAKDYLQRQACFVAGR